MSETPTLTVTQFKAKCSEILNRLRSGELERVEVTKHGKVIAVLTPPVTQTTSADGLFGFLKDQVRIPEGVDLTDPVLDEPMLAALGILHS
ncbi:type II toxin-antitoxin system Phd/YefM family antitoxin [Phenylobacterium aquaticum]|uniref:type II toxin-antitoxin system Phd/YefM family antitoxin n=1 Tax=Phenylobacterium aquaticum TaxID=1763816 RepID=UPI001F5C8AB5|nr:type II toxin-antitoxin system prevent-host-death family antitoxin [Phenylobacterium aquaticum]MCI3132606.1 type II toxin-antitoxin system prevent-host-death family antitoxin [Phenylobacterium aquaticum]